MYVLSRWSPSPKQALSLSLFCLLLAFAPRSMHGQAALRPLGQEAVYVELLGNGVLYTINYDRHFTENVSGRVGLGVLDGVAVPATVSYTLGRGSGRLELGAGAVYLSAPEELVDKLDLEAEDLDTLMGTATIGFRYQPPAGGLVFRAGFTPLFSFDGGALPWFGVSFGYAFR